MLPSKFNSTSGGCGSVYVIIDFKIGINYNVKLNKLEFAEVIDEI